MVKISLVTTCFNFADTIEDTLKSVLQQTYQNYEYIITDASSTDDTLKIINKYKKKFGNKLHVVSEKDKGIYDGMNKGIQLATGDVIGILNADDLLANKYVFENIAMIFNNKDCDGIYSDLLFMDTDTMSIPNREFIAGFPSKKRGWHPPHPTLYLKKEIYKKIGKFNLDFRIAADLDFMLRMISRDVKLEYIDKYLVHMRAGGVSTAGLKGYYKNFKESYKVLKKNNYFMPLLTNILRIFKTFSQGFSAKLNQNKIVEKIEKQNQIYPKKLIQINTVCNGSTGKIMKDISDSAEKEGYETICFYGRRKGYKNLKSKKFGNPISFWIHVGITTLFDKHGSGSYFYTKKMIRELKKENPTIIHLHNIHGYYLNYSLLFNYLKKSFNGKIYWTFHDCWPVTGHCPHFVAANCNRWKKQCHHCPNKKKYPISLFLDSSKSNYIKKKETFKNVNNLTIITPSDWMNKIVKQSFLKDYTVKTIPNGIDLKTFTRSIDKNIKNKYNIPLNKKVLLSVSSVWTINKGINDLYHIANIISDEYILVIVGLTESQIKRLPTNIIGIKKTNNISDLVKIYSQSDIFIYPSLEESFSLVTVEAISCGLPCIVLDTSAVKELINDKNGVIMHDRDYLSAIKEIEAKKLKANTIAKTSEKFTIENMTVQYIENYKKEI